MNKIILLTGAGGSGKSTIAKILNEKYNYQIIDGGELDTEFFPNGGQWLPENLDRLKLAHDRILRYAKVEFDKRKNVVIDYIIFADYKKFIEKAKYIFGKSLVIKVLYPSIQENINRDARRITWVTGPERIQAVRSEMDNLKDVISPDSYIDTTLLSGEDVANQFLI